MLGKLWSIFIVLIFGFIGNISYLSKYILWLIIGSMSYIVQVLKGNGNPSFRFSFSVICRAVQMFSKTLSCLLPKGNSLENQQ